MDREQFDNVARLVGHKPSRRAVLAALLGSVLLGHAPPPARLLARRKGKGKNKRGNGGNPPAAVQCYPGRHCIPGPGRDNAGCDFSLSTRFRGLDASGSQLSRTNFRGADLSGADLQGADLGGACLVGANLEGAKLGPSVDLDGAIFCNTVMPDGSTDDSGCERTTECCPLQVGNCPDATIICGIDDGAGFCSRVVGRFGPVGRCGNGLCCGPCENQDQSYWTERCNETFRDECNDLCVAGDTGAFNCWVGCIS